jgi:hypothetical protein
MVSLAQEPLQERTARRSQRPHDDVAADDLTGNLHLQEDRHLSIPSLSHLHVAARDYHPIGVHHDARLGDQDQVSAGHYRADLQRRQRDDRFGKVKRDVPASHAHLNALRQHPVAIAPLAGAEPVDAQHVLRLGRRGHSGLRGRQVRHQR